MTTNIKSRLSNYRTSYPCDVKLEKISDKLLNCVMAEKILFFLLEKYRVRKDREFFECPLELIVIAIDYISKLFVEKTINDIRIMFKEVYLYSDNTKTEIIKQNISRNIIMMISQNITNIATNAK